MCNLREKICFWSRGRSFSSHEDGAVDNRASIEVFEELKDTHHPCVSMGSGGSTDFKAPSGSPVLNLPVELSEPISNLLDLPSTIRLRQTCRALYHSGPALQSLILELRIHSDASSKFARLCLAERSHIEKHGPLGKLLCGGCKIYHWVGYFSAENRRREPEERMCLGQEGRLYFTPDHSISFMELVAQAKNPPALRGLLTDVKKETAYGYRPRANDGRQTPYLVSPLYQQCSSKHGLIFNYYWRFDLGDDLNGIVSIESLRADLSGKVIDLCPHVKSNDTKVVKAVHECRSRHIYTHKEALPIHCQTCQMHGCVILQIDDPWALQPDLCRHVLIHVIRRVGHLGYPSYDNYRFEKFQLDDRRAMQPLWFTQIDAPRVRTNRKIKMAEFPIMNSKRKPSFPNNHPEYYHHDLRARWGGQCPWR